MYQNIFEQINQWIEESKEATDMAAFDFIEEEFDDAFSKATSGEMVQSLTGVSLIGTK